MGDYGRFFLTLVVICIIIGALFVGALWFFWPPDKGEPGKIGHVEMCRWTKYDTSGAAIDSGYFPVTIIDDWGEK